MRQAARQNMLWAVLLAALSVPAAAETAADHFAPKRAFSTDTWETWLSLSDMIARPGFLDVYPDYPRVMPPGALAGLASAGFDTLRIPADPAPMLALWGTDREARLIESLHQRVVEGQAAGLKVILDLHTRSRPGEIGDAQGILKDEGQFATYLQVVAAVAARLADLDPDRTALELMNEPGEDCRGRLAFLYFSAHWPDHLARLHAAARTAAPGLPLVLSGPCWGGINGLETVDPAPLADDNVIWSFHSYDPFEFSHQAAFWTGEPLMFLRDLPYPPALLTDAAAERIVTDGVARAKASTAPEAAKATRETLAGIVDDYRRSAPDAATAPVVRAAAWADTHHIPRSRIFMGEFGANWHPDGTAAMDPASHARFLSQTRSAAEAAGIGWGVWSLSGPMSITDPGFTLNPVVCTALGLSVC